MSLVSKTTKILQPVIDPRPEGRYINENIKVSVQFPFDVNLRFAINSTPTLSSPRYVDPVSLSIPKSGTVDLNFLATSLYSLTGDILGLRYAGRFSAVSGSVIDSIEE